MTTINVWPLGSVCCADTVTKGGVTVVTMFVGLWTLVMVIGGVVIGFDCEGA